MSLPNILVVVVDGLRASASGAYGNTTYPTPALDHFAAESFLADWCYAPSPDLAAIYRQLWRPNGSSLSFAKQLSSSDFKTTLVTDEPALATFDSANEFDDCLQLANSNSESAHSRSHDPSETSIARLFTAAMETVVSKTHSAPHLVWLHSRGMYGPWDAPLELQEALLDESDPPPLDIIEPPDVVLKATDGPDIAFQYSSAYAAQVMVLDGCLDALLNAVASTGNDRWLIALIGSRGFPLGEHRRIGGIDARLYAEQLHVPWLVRTPDGMADLHEARELTSHVDFSNVLLRLATTTQQAQWPEGLMPVRDTLLATSPAGHRAIRTAEWCLRQDPAASQRQGSEPGAEQPQIELFVRPDDRWEANDIAKLCPAVVESLSQAMNDAPLSATTIQLPENARLEC